MTNHQTALPIVVPNVTLRRMTAFHAEDIKVIHQACASAAVSLRLATEADDIAISNLVSSHSPFTAESPGSEAFMTSISAMGIRERLMQPNFVFMVAMREEKLLGIIAIQNDVRIVLFFVDKNSQGQGIGRMLWAHALAIASARGNLGEFIVNSSLPAIEVYQKLGFVVSGERVTPSGAPEFVPMTLKLA